MEPQGISCATLLPKFQPADSFLQEEQFLMLDPEFSPKDMRLSILNHALRYRENYVRHHVDAACINMEIQRPRKSSHHQFDEHSRLLSDLPLWSVIDSFSLGLLTRFIMSCDRSSGNQIWKSVAADFEIPNQIFETTLRSLLSLKNLVAHQSRLWMRPTTDTGKRPKKFRQYLAGVDSKAMYVAFLNLAWFQGKHLSHKNYANMLQELVTANHHYWYGVSQVKEKSSVLADKTQ